MTTVYTLLMLSLLGLFCARSTAAPVGGSQPENIDQLVEETKSLATETGTASYNIHVYISKYLLLLEETIIPETPCFIRERSEQDLDPNPHTDYIQLLVENYESAKSYISYIRRVEERYNDTMNAHPDCEYCVKFKDIKQKAEQLILNLESLVNMTSSDGSQEEEGEGTPEDTSDTSESNQPLPDYCNSLCPEAQVHIFTRFEIFASVYVTLDLTGLLDQLRSN